MIKVAVKELVEMWVREKELRGEYSFIVKEGESNNLVYRIREDFHVMQKVECDLQKKNIEFHLEKRGWNYFTKTRKAMHIR